MKLRLILLVLSLLAFLSAAAGGWFYYDSLQEAGLKEAERQAVSRLEMIRKNLATLLAENVKPVRTLAGMEQLRAALVPGDGSSLAAANALLDHFQTTLDADVCYLMDGQGATIASSNRNAPDSFVGKNFSFRPYFQEAMANRPATYLALGTASGKRGVYHSYPVLPADSTSPAGVVVIKASIELIEKKLGFYGNEIVMVTDPHGIVFISNQPDWLFRATWKLTPPETAAVAASRQFGKGPWTWIGLTARGDNQLVDPRGNSYLVHRIDLEGYPGWQVAHLHSLQAIARQASDPLLRVARPIILTLCILVGLSVFLLYRKASEEILQRKAAQEALRESDARYRSLYHNTPAMLHSIDTEARLVSVSNHWGEVLGYTREEVIGRRITDFFTPESRRRAEQTVFPEFFSKGFCKDVPYRFVKKNGEVIDILLSAIGDRNEQGEIVRSLAVSIDVTERNRAVKALEQAKEELSRYSKDLEQQVSERTREITNILRYTPDVVYVKDRQGCYTLVNCRFEELFGVKNETIRGKTDYEIVPRQVADQFRCNDRQVLTQGRPCQVEEQVPQPDGIHTYLSVKFPIYDRDGAPSGVCGISTDITAVKKAQDQLRRLSGNIMANQEKERSAIARELHDELGQLLTALRMDAVWIQEQLRDNQPRVAERALAMRELIDKTIEDVRGIATRLRPGVLDDLGLVDALDWYTADFEKRSGITCIFEQQGVPDIGETVATAAYRIVQEALTNVARHARASRVEVVLAGRDSDLTLAVTDNGCGFAINDINEAEGFGLAGMRERASLAGGEVTVQSSPAKGTRVFFRVVLPGNGREGK